MSYNSRIISQIGSSTEVLSSPLALTDTDTRVAFRIATIGLTSIAVWINYSINDSTGIVITPFASHRETEGTIYNVPTMEIHTGINKVFPKVYEMDKDSDTNIVFQITTGKLLPYIEIYARASVVGANPAVINSMVITTTGDS